MSKRRIMLFVLSCFCALALARPAFAGGWAVVTVDEWPQQLASGELIQFGFTIRQHGQHPVNLENVLLTASHLDSGKTLTFTAQQEGIEGHYTVALQLPTAGSWTITVQPDRFPPVLWGPLTVTTATTTATISPRVQSSAVRMLPWLAVTVGLLGLGSAALLPQAGMRRQRIAASVIGCGLVIGGLAWNVRQPSALAAPPGATDIAYGRALFVVKGCNTCHYHAAAPNTWQADIGPNLTNSAYTLDYLRLWLKDPRAVKLNTQMPNLGLNSAEIEALAAFLTHDTP